LGGGIIGFVSNGSWLDTNDRVGFRKCIEKEFSQIYVFNLRGNQRTSGELSRKEGGKIFGPGSRAPISITLLIKKPYQKTDKAVIFYYDIGDYLNRARKLDIIRKFGTVNNIEWNLLSPNKHGDWINQRNDIYNTFIPLFEESPDSKHRGFFNIKSIGLQLKDEMFARFSSDKNLWQKILEERGIAFDKKHLFVSLYRQFFKQVIYNEKHTVHRKGQWEIIMPKDSACSINRFICVHGNGGNKPFSTIVTDTLPDYNSLDAGAQCFPLYWYEKQESAQGGLFEKGEGAYIRRDALSDFILEQARSRYGHRVEKEDIFYYVYGLLHSPEYRKTFASDLKKTLPRLPLLEKPADFSAFSNAGRELAELHLNYEKLEPPQGVKITGTDKDNFAVYKMGFPAKGQKDTIIYNPHITISNIPARAYEYMVNGKSAIEWVMERYAVTARKESGITNDPNDWAREHGKPRYILDLLLSVIAVSIKTVEIVEKLPKKYAVCWNT
jgi:predicted helicase